MGDSGNSLFRRLIQRQAAEGLSSRSGSDEVFAGELASNSGTSGGRIDNSDEYVSSNSSVLSLHPWIFRKDRMTRDKMFGSGDIPERWDYDVEPPCSPRNVNLSHGLRKNKSSIRSRRAQRYSVKPMNSVHDCLIPHLYDNTFGVEEFVFSPVSSLSVPSQRPFYITDGSRIISKSGYGLSDTFSANRSQTEAKRFGSTALVTQIQSPPEPKKTKRSSEQMQFLPDPIASRQSFNARPLQGRHDGLLLLCIGFSIGVISTMITSQKEVNKLNDLLKHGESLVQDLQEELDMKDSLTVNELNNDARENRANLVNFANNQDEISLPDNQALSTQSSELESRRMHESIDNKGSESSEYFSKIEAELEAELERLQLNMDSSQPEETFMDYEHDDIVVDVIHGELREDLLDREQSESCGNSSRTSTTPADPANYSVSPRELSLRLHELKQSRLEAQIKELQEKLHRSEKQLQLMESERTNYPNSSSDLGSSSNQLSPTIVEQGEAMSEPFCLSLSGDALDAYEEGYEELIKLSKGRQKLSSTTDCFNEDFGDAIFSSDGKLLWGLEAGLDGSFQHYNYCANKPAPKPIFDYCDDDTNIEDDDEESKMLIQRIVERTKRGSDVVLNAQKMLFSMDK